MITPTIKNEILKRIKKAETEHDVKVIFAIESGSRAWGFPSPNSDYDVRFIYVHRKEWYLDIDLERKRDVIEYEIVDEIDINGWDLRKALKLFSNSNPSFLEWIHSPINYINRIDFSERVKKLIPEIYSLEKGIYHYRSMAQKTTRLLTGKSLIPLKKYFYVLRPLLSIIWIETYKSPAPITFEHLLHLLDKDPPLKKDIKELQMIKTQSEEKRIITPVPSIDSFIQKELLRVEKYKEKPIVQNKDLSILNHFFQECLNDSTAFFHT